MLRLTAGKMYELFKLVNKPRFSSQIIVAYPEFTQLRREIEKSIGEVMPLGRWRNTFGFHYDENLFATIDLAHLDAMPDNVFHEIVYEKKSVNTFFGLSEVFFQSVFAASLVEPTTFVEFQRNNINDLVYRFFNAINSVITGLHHIVMNIFSQHGIYIRDHNRRIANVAMFISTKDALLPAFILYEEDALDEP